MTANRGMKLLGERAVAAMFKEYQQLDDLVVLGILNPDLLTPAQKQKALRAINLYLELISGAVLDGIQVEMTARGEDIGLAEEAPVEELPAAEPAPVATPT